MGPEPSISREKDGGGMPRILLSEDDRAVRDMLRATLERDGLEVVAVGSVPEALQRIATESFDLLLSDLHMPQAGDGFTVVSAMRHTHPRAPTLVLSGYPAISEALAAIRIQVDEILVKPIEIASLRTVVRERLAKPSASSDRPAVQSVAAILERDLAATIRDWMVLVEQDEQLSRIPLSFDDRAGHLPNLIADLIYRLRVHPTTKFNSIPALQHGQLRRKQGYSVAMVVEESRFLQISIFGTLQNNLSNVDFSKVLLDVMTIADEVDSQLRDAMVGYSECQAASGWSAA
jgi:CheY-like chemotaxis protein